MTVRSLVARVLPLSVKQSIRSMVYPDGPPVPPPVILTPPPPPSASLIHGAGLSMRVVPGDVISDSLLQTGEWEPELTHALLADAQEGGLLVEVGANLGYFSLLWAQVRPDNRVLAFEPSARNVRLFQKNVAANRLDTQIDLIPVAAGDRLGISTFELGPDDQTGWGGIVRNAADAAHPTKVLVAPLDALFDTDIRVAVLKVDVEGADTLVLEGCRRLLEKRQIGKIYYEQNHPRMGALRVDPDRAEALLNEAGYVARPFSGEGSDVVEWIATAASEYRPEIPFRPIA